MKIILEFDSETQRDEATHAMAADRYYSALWEFSQWMRARGKYDETKAISIDELKHVFYDLCSDAGLTFDFEPMEKGAD